MTQRENAAITAQANRSLRMAITLILACIAGASASRPGFCRAADEPSVPNIVVILADDMGFADLGCYGGEIETPQLDKLAAGGVRFTQFYNTARCCPTRASLLTGLYSHQAGIGHMTGDFGVPSYRGYLNDRCLTIAEALRPAGYATLMTGKWHVGGAAGKWPLDRGFDRYFGTPSGGGVYFKDALQLRPEIFFVRQNEKVKVADDFYVTDAFTDYALQFVDEAVANQQPFFLYLAHIAPHWPLQAKADDIAKYKGRYDAGYDEIRAARFAKQQALDLFDAQVKLSPRHPQAKAWAKQTPARQKDLARRMEIYAAQIDCIDQNVGRLVEKLRQLGVLENTVVMFLSDNGCSAEGGPGGFSRGKQGAKIGTGLSYASAGLEWANVCNTPLRKSKMHAHEGGIATPLIVHWPRGISRRGELEATPGHVIDLLPTCLELAGAKYPAERNNVDLLPPEGRSLVPAFAGKPIQREALFWEHAGNRAVRIGNWKLVAAHQGPWELYDLASDRTELNDLAKRMPDKVNELETAWNDWAKRCGVQRWPVSRRGG